MKCFWTIKRMLLLVADVAVCYSLRLDLQRKYARGWDLLTASVATQVDRKLTRWFSSYSFVVIVAVTFYLFFIIFLCHVCRINLTTSLWLQHLQRCFAFSLLEKGYIVCYTLFSVFLVNLNKEMDVTFPCMVCFGRTWRERGWFACLPVKSVTTRRETRKGNINNTKV